MFITSSGGFFAVRERSSDGDLSLSSSGISSFSRIWRLSFSEKKVTCLCTGMVTTDVMTLGCGATPGGPVSS